MNVPRTISALFAFCVLTSAQRCVASEDAPVSFRNEVMAVLSQAGCNTGPCHGNASGKAGFRLSLRGEDAGWDHNALTRDMFGRRIDRLNPDESLILIKAVTAIAHEGGKRFDRASPQYALLRDWISQGARDDRDEAPTLVGLSADPPSKILYAPETSVQVRILADFSDGSTRDVTGLSVIESANPGVHVAHDGTIRFEMEGETAINVRYLGRQLSVPVAFVPERPGFEWVGLEPANFVDRFIQEKQRALRMNPSNTIPDNQFIRRAMLDLHGRLPTMDEAREFVADTDPAKRSLLIDRLLDAPEFAGFWALKWADLLRVEEKALDRKGVELFHRWIRESIEVNKPLDEFVREIVTARGSTYLNPPANFYRSLRTPTTRGVTMAQVFLGARLQCAQCHNHPFDQWTQDEYYEWAGVFARVDYKVLENRYRDGLDKHAFVGEQIVYSPPTGEVKNPKTNREVNPRLLGAAEPLDGDDRLEAFAEWLTSPDNEFFAKVQANRIWFHLMGRGLVDPIDDFRGTNPPSHPALLERLTQEFIDSGFNLRHLIRTIMNSHAYQVSSIPNDTNAADRINYSHYQIRRLDAEPLLDAIRDVTGAAIQFKGYPLGIRACEIPGVRAVMVRRGSPSAGDKFLDVFGKPERLLATEEERSCNTNLGQAFQLMTGPVTHELLQREGNRLAQLADSDRSPGSVLEELYWTALTRPPTDEETVGLTSYLESSTNKRSALEDIAWALVNSKEFVMRH